jgi:phosphohistidine phosphatase
MRRLFLLRHAKAAPLAVGDDFDRELTDRGREDARRLGAWLADRDHRPDYAIYSGSARTKETFAIVAEALAHRLDALEQNALYDATRALILGLLRQLPAKPRACLVVGHNPGMGDAANLLAGAGDEFERLRMASKFPTCALAILAFDGPDCSELTARTGRLEAFLTPSDLE